MKTILCLDFGTNMGWALKHGDGSMGSGVVNLQPHRTTRKGARFLNMQQWLQSLGSVDVVYYERVRRHLGTQAAHCYGGFWAIMMAWCEQRGIAYIGVDVGTIKKSATGCGHAKKQQMIEAMQQLGYNPVDDNEADVLALLMCAQSMRMTSNIEASVC